MNMNLNQFTYYRANPYAKQGYLPPIAFINRHMPQFYGEIPMGEQHLQKIGRKQFNANGKHISHIQQQNLLASPEKYPYENRIAFNKQYQRNLSTIDIEGASGGSYLSMAVKNKMKAREELNRRQQQNNQTNQSDKIIQTMKDRKWEPLVNSGQTYQQQKRRKIAYEQYIKDQQLKQMKNKESVGQFGEQTTPNSKNIMQNLSNLDNARQNISNRYYFKNRGPYSQENPRPKFQSIQYSKGQESERQNRGIRNRSLLANYSNEQLGNRYNSPQSELNSPASPQKRQFYNQRNHVNSEENIRESPPLQLATDRKSLRLQNPTNLSTQSSISLAARNIINNK